MKLLKLLFKRCIEFLLTEVGEVLLEAIVSLPLNVFVVEKLGTLIQIVVFESWQSVAFGENLPELKGGQQETS